MTPADTLRVRLDSPGIIVAPGVSDGLSAQMAAEAGFDVLYMTGAGVSLGTFGTPDVGLLTLTEMAAACARITSAVGAPLIADADTGYGNALNMTRTVEEFIRAGAAAIQIEDQAYPKKCGHTSGHRLVPTDEMVTKIKVALDSRDDADFLVIARTDARKAVGHDEAMRRLEAYQEAGADILFFEAPANVEEMADAARRFDTPLMANMVEGGATPVLTPNELEALGFRVAIFPASGFLAATEALTRVYAALHDTGSSTADGAPLHSFKDFIDLMGFDEVLEFESRFD
ncbi:MAG TPA: carboxyvinyl-carboxyphosphonate phosphorylmutase [Nitrospinae bacterium]|nr:carboxyvinyl-carboxyphosphonate phosphorylmutase [Nitrospinota bacterium]